MLKIMIKNNVIVNVKDNVNDIVNVNDNVKYDVNDNDKDNVKDNVNVKDDVKDNIDDYDDDQFINMRSEQNPCSGYTNQPKVKGSLQLLLCDEDIIDNVAIRGNFRCIISAPSECGKTFFLKELIISNIYFDKLYIIGPAGEQYEVVESYKGGKA